MSFIRWMRTGVGTVLGVAMSLAFLWYLLLVLERTVDAFEAWWGIHFVLGYLLSIFLFPLALPVAIFYNWLVLGDLFLVWMLGGAAIAMIVLAVAVMAVSELYDRFKRESA